MNSRNPESATTIRYPATANLMIDSADRNEAVDGSPWKFFISRPNSILNGFFNRIATSEVVLEWCVPNGDYIGNVTITLDMSGTKTFAFTNPGLFYTAEAALNALADVANSQFSTTIFQVTNNPGVGILFETSDDSPFEISGPGADQLDIILRGQGQYPGFQIGCPDLRPYRYIDFTSSQLTYNQDLKDSSTAPITRDVLCRWYFAWDTPPTVDAYGFPILMGYTQFRTRRLYNPPKQIKWEKAMPLGQLGFEVYDDQSQPLFVSNDPTVSTNQAEWLMTLQVSEN